MRALAAVSVFVATLLLVLGVGWLVFSLATPAAGGLVLAALWSAASVLLARLRDAADGWRLAGWAIFGFLLGPFVTAWLAWQTSPKVLAIARRVR